MKIQVFSAFQYCLSQWRLFSLHKTIKLSKVELNITVTANNRVKTGSSAKHGMSECIGKKNGFG